MGNIGRELDREVRIRAGHRCEYCHLPQACVKMKLVIDHIRPRQHHGLTVADNLALCCGRCNGKKGPNLSGIDPEMEQVTILYNPRTQQWRDHFRWNGVILVGVTQTARATIDVFAINSPDRILLRRELSASGEFPRDFE